MPKPGRQPGQMGVGGLSVEWAAPAAAGLGASRPFVRLSLLELLPGVSAQHGACNRHLAADAVPRRRTRLAGSSMTPDRDM